MTPNINPWTLLVILAPPVLVVIILGVLWFQPPDPSPSPSPSTTRFQAPPGSNAWKRGRALYHTHCSSCHGSEGRGNGPAAPFMNPSPRDFHSSRAANMTGKEMMRVIREGKANTGMPAWKGRLSRQQIRWLVGYLREEFVRSDDADSPVRSPGPTEPEVSGSS